MPRRSSQACIRHVWPCDLTRLRLFMKSRPVVFAGMLICCAIAIAAPAQYRNAVPGYRYNFPRDHFNHPDFQMEWWYYTGNVKSADGHRFGFELTFFRQGVDRDSKTISTWGVR